MNARLAVWQAAWVLAATLAEPGAAQRTPVDVSKLGPQVGERVPGFTLVDQWGARRSLSSVLGPKGGMLVFFRSVDW